MAVKETWNSSAPFLGRSPMHPSRGQGCPRQWPPPERDGATTILTPWDYPVTGKGWGRDQRSLAGSMRPLVPSVRRLPARAPLRGRESAEGGRGEGVVRRLRPGFAWT